MLSRGQLADCAGINRETIRFYERKGLLPLPLRTAAGYRQYSQEDLKRLQFILSAKRHGFTLAEIKELLKLRVSAQTSCEQVREKALKKIELINEKLQELERIKKSLVYLSQQCHDEALIGECPVLKAFSRYE